MSKFAVILPAAGKSTRFAEKNKRKKTFIELKGRPVWVRAAECFVNRNDVIQTIIVVAPDDFDWFKEKFRPNLAFMDIEIVAGGASRAESVQNGLSQVTANADFVAVHDAARPLITSQWIDDVFKKAEETGAAIPAIPIPGTIKQVNDKQTIEQTVPREKLWQAQTPQVFSRELLLKAFEKQDNFTATDEAQLVEQYGHAVSVVTGSPMNFKITTADDFKMAEAVLGHLPKPKGLSSLHPFADESPGFLD
ncbi:2-C-methyl-D-erythritol 4-phosphate cytidylyltransferase [hydrothermal vent metagenome]|uniref:2-C-methyl-D-erythritol 4-phosphate cytidylyltransferase n=1 Tax=hydrothermal vent metagenome TaxID=652676 RepID=A0A3B1E6B1_9ZZZZ